MTLQEEMYHVDKELKKVDLELHLLSKQKMNNFQKNVSLSIKKETNIKKNVSPRRQQHCQCLYIFKYLKFLYIVIISNVFT